MNQSLEELMKKSKEIASKHERPQFYTRFHAEIARARHLYFTDPLITMIRETVEEEIEKAESLGHGIYHSSRVAWDCGALLEIELRFSGSDHVERNRIITLGIIAGLLHDICRCEENHAERGAQKAAKILKNFPISETEISFICRAIRNHEAFVKPTICPDPIGQLISDCLYDADKFRWGIDNFTHTLWFMVDHQGLSPHSLIERFPWGIEGIRKIINTFRTPVGKQFGPEIIEKGIEIGKEIYRYLLKIYQPDNSKEGATGW